MTCESGSLALLVDCIGSGRGARCTVSSWKRSCCPGGASCCWTGREKEHAHEDATIHDILSRKHAFDVRACEKIVVFVMHATGVFCVHTCRIVGPTFGLSETACFKKMSLTAFRQALKNATTMNSNFAMRNSATMRTTKTKYAAGFPAALCTISILFSDQQRNHDLHFLRIADSDFGAFACSDELFCRTALFPPHTRLVVADTP